jgi:hypothetical protein
MLEEQLALARQGKILSIAMVTVAGPGNFTPMGTLTGLLELSAGCDDLKDTIKAAMRAAAMAAAQPRPSGIIRPSPDFDPQHRP